MAPTSSRLLSLLSLLQSRRFWPGVDLAERLGVAPRTLRRDIERLRELGYPVEAQRGSDGGYQLAAGASLPPLVLDDEEAIALGVGLRAAVQAGAVANIGEASARALAKVLKVMPAPLRRQIDALTAMTEPAPWRGDGSAVDPGVLATLAQGARDSEVVELDYTARDGARSERRIEPHRLVLYGRRWYLVAFDLTRFDWRSFRVDRVASARVTSAHAAPRELPAADAVEFVRQNLASLPRPYRVEAVVEAGADLVRERIGAWTSVEALSDGRSRVELSTDSLEWAVAALALTGAEFRAAGPPELRAVLLDWHSRLYAAASAIELELGHEAERRGGRRPHHREHETER